METFERTEEPNRGMNGESQDSLWYFQKQLDELADCHAPLLIGVRHHSAALSRAITPLLDAFAPEQILLELPSEFSDWIEYLADEDTVAPVAISAVDPDGNLSFYPLADFSPEWVAIRWAHKNKVPIIPFDLWAGAACKEFTKHEYRSVMSDWEQIHRHQPEALLLDELLARTDSRDVGQLWERLVETPGVLNEPEKVRRAALLFGLAIRRSAPSLSYRDLVRESAMREGIRKHPGRTAAIIGSFHASDLTPSLVKAATEHDRSILQRIQTDIRPVGISLVPYSFEQIDERSGYPAGIRDPVWHERMLTAEHREDAENIAAELVVDICRQLRLKGHVAGTPDAAEIIRMMRALANIRRLPSVGRGELIEAIQSCLVQGELHGRARQIAQAMENVLVGDRKGRVTQKVPRCGLAKSIDETLDLLKLPRDTVKEIQIDPLRDSRDRARGVFFRQLSAAKIPYARRLNAIEHARRENLIENWEVGFRQGTSASIESVSRFGANLPLALEGMLRLQSDDQDSQEPSTTQWTTHFEIASECGLQGFTRQKLKQLDSSLLNSAQLPQLVAIATHIGRIASGFVLGLPRSCEQEHLPILKRFDYTDWGKDLTLLVRTSLDRLSGISGSSDPSDVVGVCELSQWMLGRDEWMDSETSDQLRTQIILQGIPHLTSWCQRTLIGGSSRMRGASIGILCLMNERTPEELSELLLGWILDAVDLDTRNRLKEGLAGVVQVLLAKMQSDPSWLDGLDRSLRSIYDDTFLRRLNPLRAAFHEFSPADRQRILDLQLERLDDRSTKLSLGNLSDSPAEDIGHTLAALRRADLAGRASIEAMLPQWMAPETVYEELSTAPSLAEQIPSHASVGEHSIQIADRWRMILGITPDSDCPGYRAARSLDQLYGAGRGEGVRGDLIQARGTFGSDTQEPVPSAAKWAEDLEAFFGSDVCQEVLGAAAQSGHLGAVGALDPDTVVPSTQLLQQILSLAGGMSEGKMQKLRLLAKRITEQLARALSVRMQPHVHGLSSPRPTRHRNRRLNLHQTIRRNLAHPIRRQDGRASVIAKDLIFQSAAKRQMDWHLTFVVDVSGSMSNSVVYSALCAAIFAELPALTVRFLAFSTQVVDLTDHVQDPLALLLEVHVGGGTHIGLGLRAARTGLRVPSRSIVVLVSDFEEGVSIGEMVAEVRTMIESGIKCVGLAALDDQAVARFHQGCAELLAAAGMPVAAVSPEKLAQWVSQQIRGS